MVGDPVVAEGQGDVQLLSELGGDQGLVENGVLELLAHEVGRDQEVVARYLLYHLEGSPDGDRPQLRKLVGLDPGEPQVEVDEVTPGRDAVELRKASEHGLGLYLSPTGRRGWIEAEAAPFLLDRLRGGTPAEPGWLDLPAMTRLSASTPHMLRPFRTVNRGKPYAEQVKPFNFLLSPHPRRLGGLPVSGEETELLFERLNAQQVLTSSPWPVLRHEVQRRGGIAPGRDGLTIPPGLYRKHGRPADVLAADLRDEGYGFWEDAEDFLAQLAQFREQHLRARQDARRLPHDNSRCRFHLVSSFETDPSKWLGLRGLDLYSGRQFEIATRSHELVIPDGPVVVKSYRLVFEEYLRTPEAKFVDSVGQDCGPLTTGPLLRRTLRIEGLRLIGKEGNRLDDRQAGLVHEVGDYLREYHDPAQDPWETIVRPIMAEVRVDRLAVLSGVSTSAIIEARNGARPKPDTRLDLLRGLAAYCEVQMAKTQPKRSSKASFYSEDMVWELLRRYRRESAAWPVRCPGCGAPRPARAKHCANGCTLQRCAVPECSEFARSASATCSEAHRKKLARLRLKEINE